MIYTSIENEHIKEIKKLNNKKYRDLNGKFIIEEKHLVEEAIKNNLVEEILLLEGVRLAEPGEFTKRAFMNGRIDLTQAEAVMDVINSETERSLKCANIGLHGDVKKLINQFKEQIMDCITKIEVNIDYPEYDDEVEMTNDIIKPILNDLVIKLKDIISKKRLPAGC